MRYEHDPHYPLALHDPAAVDFRAFYPYTPNEVKHRRRTTSAQLKVLEAIFRVDTKPNATLRNDLAAQLGMTARGVQVWFQNRRAKEKNKANKKHPGNSAAATPGNEADPNADSNTKDEDDTDPASPPPATPGEELLEELLKAEPALENQPADSQTSSPSPALASPPKLHLVTDPAVRPSSAASWKPSPSDETPPDSAVFPSRHPLLAAELRSQRRGSLPANAFFHPFATSSTHVPRSIDVWDPLARRRSVDTSLQRLVAHPYAQHALAKNGALFGPRSPSQPQSGRQSSLSGKKSLPLQTRRPFMPHRPPNRYLDMRRASMDPRTLMPSATADGLSPSSSPRPLLAVRASLPDTSLYITTRRYVPQLSGPLPEPGFTFGNASVSSPTEDEPPSPDLSSYSFPPRDDATEDDDVMSSVSFETLSRFGSAVSIATSESSVFSNPAFYDIGDLAPNQDRRGSCGSAHQAQLPCVTASLDEAMPSQQSPAPVTADGYFDESSTPTVLAAGVNQPQVDDIASASSFTSPRSTTSPDDGSATHSSTPPDNGPVSNTNELVSAFTPGSQNSALTIDGSSSLSHLGLSVEQRLQQQLVSSHTQANQQQLAGSGHQTQAVENDGPYSFDNSSENRIDMANPSSETNPTLSVLSRQDVTGLGSMSKQLQQSNPLSDEVAHGDFTTRFPDLMDGMGFGAALAMFDNEPSSSVIGQAGQRSGTATGCDPLASLGLGIDVDAFATGGVVAPEAYGASGIVPNQPTFAS